MSTIRRRSVLTGLGLASLSALVAACAPRAITTEDGRTILRVIGWKGTEGEPARIAEIHARFSAENPDIELIYESVSGSAPYAQRVQPELLAGEASDVLMVDPTFNASWADEGFTADLRGADWVGRIDPALAGFAAGPDGTVTAMPMEAIGLGLYVNATMLRAAGVAELPRTWPDFLAALEALRAAGATPITMPNQGGWTGSTTALAAAANTTPADWDQRFFRRETTFADYRPAVDQIFELQQRGFVNLRDELGRDEWVAGVADFSSGRTGFLFQGAWNLSSFADVDFEVVFLPWPGGAAGADPVALLVSGTSWSINATTPVRAAADRYLAFWAKPDVLLEYLTAEAAFSPYVGGTHPELAGLAPFAAAFTAGRARYMPQTTWMSGDYQTTFGTRIQSLILGEISEDQFLQAITDSAPRAE